MNENRKPIYLPMAILMVMQVAIAVMMLWGYFGNAWDKSWIASYIGVCLCIELFYYNNVVKKGQHPIKAFYPTFIMIGFAFFFFMGFVFNGWSYSWIGLAAAAVAILILIPIDKAVSKKALKPEEAK